MTSGHCVDLLQMLRLLRVKRCGIDLNLAAVLLFFILFYLKKNIKIKFYFILLYFILLLFHAFFYSCFVLIGALFKQYSFNYGKSLHIAILLYMLHYAKCSIWGPAVVQGRAWSVLQGGPFPLCIIIKSLGWMF